MVKIHVDKRPFGHDAFTPYPGVYVLYREVRNWHPADRACLLVHERAHTVQYLATSVLSAVALALLHGLTGLPGWAALALYPLALPIPFWIAWALPPLRRRLERWADNRQLRCLKERGRI